MCLAVFYLFAYSHCKVSITRLDWSHRFLLLSETLMFSCQHPDHSSPWMSDVTSVSEGGRMVHMVESGQDVSKFTFRNVSCFIFIPFGLVQRSAEFAVRQCSLNKKQKVEERRLGYLCYCNQQANFSFTIGTKLTSTPRVFLCLVNQQQLGVELEFWTIFYAQL